MKSKRIGRWFDKHNGYWIVSVKNHPLFPKQNWVAEHRKILAEKLGRSLKSSELTHHVDEDKQNNNPSNLELTDRSCHAAFHSRGRKYSAKTRQKMSILAKERNARPEYNAMIRKRAKRQHREGNLGWVTWPPGTTPKISRAARQRRAENARILNKLGKLGPRSWKRNQVG